MSCKLVELPPPQESLEARALIEEVLELTDGRLQAVAIVAVLNDGNVATSFSGDSNIHTLLGGVCFLNKRLCDCIEEL